MSIIEKAQAVHDQLGLADFACSEQRSLTDSSWELIQSTGVLQALQPRRWGGTETTPAEYFAAVIEIGRASASAGWVSSVVGVHPWHIALFPEQTQKECWGENPRAAYASAYTPLGTVTKVDGGYTVSGTWSFSTGIDRCDGVILGAMCGEQVYDGQAFPDFVSIILHKNEYHVEDVWRTAGLKGTGSNNVVVTDLFVPEHRVMSNLVLTKGLGTPVPGQELNDGALYKLPWAVLFNLCISSGAVGACYGFLDLWTEETTTRRTNYGTLLRDEAVIQAELADAIFAIDGARLRIMRACEELMATAEAGEIPDEDARAFYRWDVAKAAQVAVDAVTHLMRKASGRTAFVDHPLHQKFQDVMAASGHAFLYTDSLAKAIGGRRLHSDLLPAVHL